MTPQDTNIVKLCILLIIRIYEYMYYIPVLYDIHFGGTNAIVPQQESKKVPAQTYNITICV